MGKEYTLDILVSCFRMLVRIYHVCKSFPFFFLLANQRTYILLSVIHAFKYISHLFYPSPSLSLPFPYHLPSPSISSPPPHSGQILGNKVQGKSHCLKAEFKWQLGFRKIHKYVFQREFWCKCENTVTTAKWCLFSRNACKPELVCLEHCSYLL